MARGSIQSVKGSKNKWRIRLYLGEDINGKQKFWTHTHTGKKSEADAILSEKILELQRTGTVMQPSKQNFGNYILEWKESSLKSRVRQKTFESYSYNIDRYLMPELEMIKISRITPKMIQGIYGHMLTEKNLSARTVKYTHNILSSALKQAVRWGLIPTNPCDLVSLPKQSKTEMHAMTADQVKAFLRAAEGDRLKVLFELQILTGLRPGEAYGLKWSDLDLKKGTLSVRRSVSRPKGGVAIFTEPKTAKSVRSMPIPSGLIESLKKQRALNAADEMASKVEIQRIKEKIKSGEISLESAEKYISQIKFENHDLVFPSANGQPLDHSNVVTRHFKPIMEKAGLKGFRPYDLRHTCATLMLSAGVHVKVAAERLGHASVTLTMDTYSHVLPDMQNEASEKLNAMIY